MLTIARLFGKSPFAPLQTHMDKVACCVSELPALFRALIDQEMDTIHRVGEQICALEYEADLTKTDIQTHLPKSLFLQVDRTALLTILSLQDSIADQAGSIAVHAKMREIPLLKGLQDDFAYFCCKSVEAFWLARKVIQELEGLLESSFGGIEAQKVKGMTEQISFSECEMTIIQNKLAERFYREGDAMPCPVFHLSLSLIEKIGQIAHFSEKLGNRVRMLLEIK